MRLELVRQVQGGWPQAEVARQQHNEELAIPDGFDYALVRGLSNEVRTKLAAG